MRSRFLALGMLAVLAAPAAHATVYNTINTPSAGAGAHDGFSDGLPFLADSFQASGGFNSITASLLLSAPTHDSKSLSVYLVADSGTGGSGIPALPSWSTSSQLIGTISDNTLASTPTVATVSAVLQSPASPTNEYWVEVVLNTSTADWYGSLPGQGTGIANQSAGWGTSQTDLAQYYLSSSDSHGVGPVSLYGSYSLEVSVPEPATVGLLGIGLASLGVLRRRRRA